MNLTGLCGTQFSKDQSYQQLCSHVRTRHSESLAAEVKSNTTVGVESMRDDSEDEQVSEITARLSEILLNHADPALAHQTLTELLRLAHSQVEFFRADINLNFGPTHLHWELTSQPP